ncbi:hypothetical protein [Oceanobacillus jeddahense]|uniref:hypothetical protein n=1 Tax=Oceanobacillus jeddahense TaxID=1462527 RepID=UPI0011DDF51C|nr:hypothetical protein [Oceanobacillus jeddahense]
MLRLKGKEKERNGVGRSINKRSIPKGKKKLRLSSIRFFCVFLLASLLMMVIRSNYAHAIDYIGPSVLGGLIYYFGNYVGLRRSYRRNREAYDH